MSDKVFGHEIWDFTGEKIKDGLLFLEKHANEAGSNMTADLLFALGSICQRMAPKFYKWAGIQQSKGRQAS